MPNKVRKKTIQKIIKSSTKKTKPSKPKKGMRTQKNIKKGSGYGKK